MDKTEQTISKELADMMITQLSREMYNHNVYKTYANFFFVRGLGKLFQYYEHRANEEYNHHNWFYDRLCQCGIEFDYPAIPSLKKEHQVTSHEQTFINTVALEIETTKEINAIIEQAIKEKDYTTEHWLKEVLLEEQHEEETISRFIRNISESKGDWIGKEGDILDFYNDREYATSDDREIINACKCKKK